MMLFSHREGRIVKDATWLQPLSDPPNGKPLCRDGDLKEMASYLADLFTLGQGRNLFIVGMPGTGKTLCLKFLLDEIRRHAMEANFPLAAVCVNAGKTRSPYYTMLEITKSLGVQAPSCGWQMLRLKQAFETTLKEKAVVIGIDEVDSLLQKQREPLIYYLNRQPKTTLILVSNKIQDASTLPNRALSTLQPKLVRLRPYTPEEVKTILRERAQKALSPSTISDQLLNPIAAIASEAKDIRLGFTILLTAAHKAEEKAKSQIGPEEVEAAIRSETVLELLKEIHRLEKKRNAPHKGKSVPQPSWTDSLLS